MESILSFYHVGPGEGAQVLRLDDKSCDLLSHCTFVCQDTVFTICIEVTCKA